MFFRALVAAFLTLVPAAHAQEQRLDSSASNPASLLTLPQVWALDATYTDAPHGVSFRHPSVWKSAIQFGYHVPSLAESGKVRPIAGFGFEEGGFPTDHVAGPYSATNLEGFGVVYAALPAADAGACETTAALVADAHDHHSVKFAGRSFSERDTGEAGMSQSVYGALYSTYLRGFCYLFETSVAIASGQDEDPIIHTLSPEQFRMIDAHLLSIMKSVRISTPLRRKN